MVEAAVFGVLRKKRLPTDAITHGQLPSRLPGVLRICSEVPLTHTSVGWSRLCESREAPGEKVRQRRTGRLPAEVVIADRKHVADQMVFPRCQINAECHLMCAS